MAHLQEGHMHPLETATPGDGVCERDTGEWKGGGVSGVCSTVYPPCEDDVWEPPGDEWM